MGTKDYGTGVLAMTGILGLLAGCSFFNVPSGPGMPAGPSLRTATHVLTLIATDEPHPPRLQPNQVQVVPRKIGLLLTPLDGSAAPPVIEIARKVPPSSDPNAFRLLGVAENRVWICAGATYVYDLNTRRLSQDGTPLRAEAERSFSDAVTTGWRVTETRWMGLHMPDDIAKGKLKPGSPVMPGIFPLRSVPYEFVREGQLPTRERRRLYLGQIDTSGPIPRFTAVEPVSEDEYSNGVVLKGFENGDGALLAYEGRYPDLTLHVRRIDAEGRTQWTVNTRITREPQIVAGSEQLIVLRGVPQVPDGKFPQPIVVLLNPQSGQMSTHELRW